MNSCRQRSTRGQAAPRWSSSAWAALQHSFGRRGCVARCVIKREDAGRWSSDGADADGHVAARATMHGGACTAEASLRDGTWESRQFDQSLSSHAAGKHFFATKKVASVSPAGVMLARWVSHTRDVDDALSEEAPGARGRPLPEAAHPTRPA